jgi:hypothetical protein
VKPHNHVKPDAKDPIRFDDDGRPLATRWQRLIDKGVFVPRADLADGESQCAECGKILPNARFVKSSNTKDKNKGLALACEDCRRKDNATKQNTKTLADEIAVPGFKLCFTCKHLKHEEDFLPLREVYDLRYPSRKITLRLKPGRYDENQIKLASDHYVQIKYPRVQVNTLSLQLINDLECVEGVEIHNDDELNAGIGGIVFDANQSPLTELVLCRRDKLPRDCLECCVRISGNHKQRRLDLHEQLCGKKNLECSACGLTFTDIKDKDRRHRLELAVFQAHHRNEDRKANPPRNANSEEKRDMVTICGLCHCEPTIEYFGMLLKKLGDELGRKIDIPREDYSFECSGAKCPYKGQKMPRRFLITQDGADGGDPVNLCASCDHLKHQDSQDFIKRSRSFETLTNQEQYDLVKLHCGKDACNALLKGPWKLRAKTLNQL